MTEIAPGLDLTVADCLDALRELDADSVDAVVTDPPYGIRFMGKAWDGAQIEHEVERRRALGREADGGDFGNAAQSAGIYDVSAKGNRAFQSWTEAWAREAFRVLKPGGHLLSFASTRTYHRMAAGVEDAGFEIRDTLAWMFGSGFPKSLDVAKAIDKAAGVAGERGEMKRGGERLMSQAPDGVRDGGGTWGDESGRDPYLYVPASDDAKTWQGWGTALKPAFEPIVVARKPLIGTVAGNVLAHGVGGLNVDACRIATDDPLGGGAEAAGNHKQGIRHEGWERPWQDDDEAREAAAARAREGVERAEALGRWPANVLLGHSPDCVLVGTREVASDGHYPSARPGGVEIGTVGHAGQDGLEERSTRGETVEVWDCVPDCPVRLLDEQTGDVGAAAPVRGTEPSSVTDGIYGEFAGRVPGAFYGDRGGASRFFYVAKVSRAERNAGLDGFDPRPLHWSSGDANPGSFQGEGTDKTARNAHPTVKPVALMRWLIRLVTPPGGLVLDPFAGSGSTGCAAALEGARFLGIERDPDYAKIAEARIRFWAEHGEEALRVVAGREASERAREAVAASGQLDLLGGT